jgi:hypothetical protein
MLSPYSRLVLSSPVSPHSGLMGNSTQCTQVTQHTMNTTIRHPHRGNVDGGFRRKAFPLEASFVTTTVARFHGGTRGQGQLMGWLLFVCGAKTVTYRALRRVIVREAGSCTGDRGTQVRDYCKLFVTVYKCARSCHGTAGLHQLQL